MSAERIAELEKEYKKHVMQIRKLSKRSPKTLKGALSLSCKVVSTIIKAHNALMQIKILMTQPIPKYELGGIMNESNNKNNDNHNTIHQ